MCTERACQQTASQTLAQTRSEEVDSCEEGKEDSNMETDLELQTNGQKAPAQKALPPAVGKERETAILGDADTPFLVSRPGDYDDDLTEDEDEERLKSASCVGRVVVHLQQGLRRALSFINHKFGGYFFVFIFLLLYLAYFSYAMYYRFGDEGSIRLVWCTVLGVVIAGRHRAWRVLRRTNLVTWCVSPKPPSTARRIHTFRFFLRWLLYGGVGAFMAYVIVDVAIKDPVKLRSLPGIIIFLLVCFLFSTHPSKVNWHMIYWSVGMQFILAVMVMRWQGGKELVLWIQSRLDGFFDNAKPASRLVFGNTYTDHYFIFGVIPILFLTNSALSMLYHVGAMQFIVRIIGSVMRFILGSTAIESTTVAASIFMDGPTALLATRPYMDGLTKSELFTLTTACLASIGGAFLAMLAQLGIPVELTLPAMVISAPATFAVCKLVVPETRQPQKLSFRGDLPQEMQYTSLLEAAQAGAISVISLVANVVVSAFALFSLISWVNTSLTWLGHRVGVQQLTLEQIMSYIFFPCSFVMGVELADCRSVAMLMGFRLWSTNIVAMMKMVQLMKNREKFYQYSLLPNATITRIGDHIVLDKWNTTLIDGFISRRSEAIATYALCGFSGILSLVITFSILATLVPKRQPWILKMAIPLLITGNLANFMVGCFAGLLVDYD